MVHSTAAVSVPVVAPKTLLVAAVVKCLGGIKDAVTVMLVIQENDIGLVVEMY